MHVSGMQLKELCRFSVRSSSCGFLPRLRAARRILTTCCCMNQWMQLVRPGCACNGVSWLLTRMLILSLPDSEHLSAPKHVPSRDCCMPYLSAVATACCGSFRHTWPGLLQAGSASTRRWGLWTAWNGDLEKMLQTCCCERRKRRPRVSSRPIGPSTLWMPLCALASRLCSSSG